MVTQDKRRQRSHEINIDLPLLKEWDFKIFEAKSQGKVTKLETDVGTKCLQIRREHGTEVFHLFLVLEHLAHQGFKRIPRFVRTKYGEPYIQKDELTYWVSDWIHGRHINMKDRDDLIKSVRHLAELHKVSKEFYLSEEKADCLPENNWGSRFLQMTAQITDIKYQITGPAFLKTNLQYMTKRAVSSCKTLVGPGYSSLKDQMIKDRGFCHGAYNKNHLIMGKSGDIYITGLIHWKRDIRLRDLADFLLAAGEANNWHYAICQEVVFNYQRISPLLPQETELLHAYLGFPFGYWELLKDLSQRNAGAQETKAKLEAYLEREEEKEKCLRNLF